MDKSIISDEELRKRLTKEQYEITRKKATEPAFSGKYHDFDEKGTYKCICCNNELFSSEVKYHSGTGWPSFWAPISKAGLVTCPDYSHGMMRTEVKCAVCDSHLGHVFQNEPTRTGLRYCINSGALQFEKNHNENA
jgi:peptide-methionine (R)-S-oxide reductase